jgi:hypothetical protein
MKKSDCRGCNYYDSENRYCGYHDQHIVSIEDCDDYDDGDYVEQDELDTMFPDGIDDGYCVTLDD